MTKTVTSKAVTKFRGNVPDQHQLFVNVLTIASHLKQEEKTRLDLVNKKWEDDYKEDVQMRCSRKKVTWSKNLHRIRSISPRQVISPQTKVARYVVTSPSTSEDHSTNKSNYSMIDQSSPTNLDNPFHNFFSCSKRDSGIIEMVQIKNFNMPNIYQKSLCENVVLNSDWTDKNSNMIPSQSEPSASVPLTFKTSREREQEYKVINFSTKNTCESTTKISILGKKDRHSSNIITYSPILDKNTKER